MDALRRLCINAPERVQMMRANVDTVASLELLAMLALCRLEDELNPALQDEREFLPRMMTERWCVPGSQPD